MGIDDIQGVQMEKAGDANHFIRHAETGRLIGRVWQELNGEWWATFYLGSGSAARNVYGGKFDTQGDAIAGVWNQVNSY